MFAALDRDAIACIQSIMEEYLVFTKPDLSSWSGEHWVQCEIIRECPMKHDAFECLLLDMHLPSNVFQTESAMQQPSHVCPFSLAVPHCSLKLKVGDVVACRVLMNHANHERKAVVIDSNLLFRVSKSDPGKPFNMAHLFCGAFHGWGQATRFLDHCLHVFQVNSQVSVDWDATACAMAAGNNNAQLIDDPFNQLVGCLEKQIVIKCDVRIPVWMKGLCFEENMVWTASFPCPPFTKAKSYAEGMNSPEGRSLVYILAEARLCRPLLILLENVDAFGRHPHKKIMMSIAKWAGYKLVWSMIHDLAQIANASRSRWLGILIRTDLLTTNADWKFTPVVSDPVPTPWSSLTYNFPLPDSLRELLTLSEEMKSIYGDIRFLPKSRISEHTVDVFSVLLARCSDTQSPLATLVARYTQQHLLPSGCLEDRGIYAELIQCNGKP